MDVTQRNARTRAQTHAMHARAHERTRAQKRRKLPFCVAVSLTERLYVSSRQKGWREGGRSCWALAVRGWDGMGMGWEWDGIKLEAARASSFMINYPWAGGQAISRWDLDRIGTQTCIRSLSLLRSASPRASRLGLPPSLARSLTCSTPPLPTPLSPSLANSAPLDGIPSLGERPAGRPTRPDRPTRPKRLTVLNASDLIVPDARPLPDSQAGRASLPRL